MKKNKARKEVERDGVIQQRGIQRKGGTTRLHLAPIWGHQET
jgi:hypothetical protein